MEHGTVKWFSPQKGYGFITRRDGSNVFVHYTGLAPETGRRLTPDEAVEFEVIPGERGPKAVNIRRVEAESGRAAGANGF